MKTKNSNQTTATWTLMAALEDSTWSSPGARAKGLASLGLAVAQLDQAAGAFQSAAFSRLLALRVTQKIMPGVLRDYAEYAANKDVIAITSSCEAAATMEDVEYILDRLSRLDSLDTLARPDSLSMLDRLDSLARLARLARLASLDRLDSLDRLSRLARRAEDNLWRRVADVAVEVLGEMKVAS